MVFQPRFDITLALFFTCLIINAYGWTDDPVLYRWPHQFNVRDPTTWNEYRINAKTLNGSAISCKPDFCVFWNDTAGFGFTSKPKQTPLYLSFVSSRLLVKDGDSHCWDTYCVLFDQLSPRSLTVIISIENMHPDSIDNVTTLSVLPHTGSRRRLPRKREKSKREKRKSRLGMVAVGGRSAMKRLTRFKEHKFSKTEAQAVMKALALAQTGVPEYIRRSSLARAEPSYEGEFHSLTDFVTDSTFGISAGDFSVDINVHVKPEKSSEKNSKEVLEWIENLWNEAIQLQSDVINVLDDFEKWKLDVYHNALTAFAKKEGKWVDRIVDVALGVLSGNIKSVVDIGVTAAKVVAMEVTEEKREEATRKAKETGGDIKARLKEIFLRTPPEESPNDKQKRLLRQRAEEYLAKKPWAIAKEAGTTAAKSVMTSVGAAIVVGAIVGGPAAPITATAAGVGVLLFKVARPCIKAVYLKVRSDQKIEKIDEAMEEIFNTLDQIRIGDKLINFKDPDLDIRQKQQLCFLVYWFRKMNENVQGYRVELSTKTIPTAARAHALEGEMAPLLFGTHAHILSGAEAGDTMKMGDITFWAPLAPIIGDLHPCVEDERFEEPSEADERECLKLIAIADAAWAEMATPSHESGTVVEGERTTMHSAADPMDPKLLASRKARSEYHNQYNQRFDAIDRYNEHELNSKHSHSHHHYQDDESYPFESHGNSVMIGGLFGGTGVIIIIIVFCIGLACGMMGCWNYTQNKDSDY